MTRRIVGMLLLLLMLASLVAVSQETYQALLGEAVSGHVFFGGTFRSLDLYDRPGEPGLMGPSGDDIVYGVARLGSHADNLFSVVVRLGEDPLLWIDANNNEDVYDDGSGNPDVVNSAGSCTWYRDVLVSYWKNDVSSQLPYSLKITATRYAGEWHFNYISNSARKGLLAIDDALWPVWLIDMDSDGRFDDIADLAIGIDDDGDGELLFSFDGLEWFGEGFPLDEPGLIQVDGSFYGLVSVSSDGRQATFEKRAPDRAPLPILRVGYPLPLQTASTLSGEALQLADYAGSPLVLLFAPLIQLFPEYLSCEHSVEWLGRESCLPWLEYPRSTGTARALERTRRILEQAFELQQDTGAKILLAATDPFLLGDVGFDFISIQRDCPVPVLWDESLLLDYRIVLYGLIVIDSDGVIVARDAFAPTYDSAGHIIQSDLNPLPADAIGDILEPTGEIPASAD